VIKIEEIPSGFRLIYKEHLLIQHSSKNPCLYIGSGTGRFKSNYGHFKIKDKVQERLPLTDFEIVSQDPKKTIINLTTQSEKVNLIFEINGDFLIIKPTCTNPKINRFWLNIHAQESEAVFGCGEQFSEFNLRGKTVPLWVQENGLCRGDPKWLTFLMNLLAGVGGHWYSTYYPQPTFVSSLNYFCHVDTTAYAKFNFKNPEYHELHIWEIPDRIIIGKYNSALETVGKLSDFLGRQPRLPEWVFDGVWLGIQGGNEIVEQKIQQCVEKGVAVKAAWCQDWEGIRMRRFGKRLFWNWKYDNNLYPDLPSFIETLNAQGIRFLGYINSFLTVEENAEMYNEASAKGYCVKDQEGHDYIIKTGNGITALLDLTFRMDGRFWGIPPA
jgi:alpha-glucosidase